MASVINSARVSTASLFDVVTTSARAIDQLVGTGAKAIDMLDAKTKTMHQRVTIHAAAQLHTSHAAGDLRERHPGPDQSGQRHEAGFGDRGR